MIILGAQDKKQTKLPGTGQMHPESDEEKTPGYRQPKEKVDEEDKDEKETTRKPHKRDNTHQQQVGMEGEDSVIRLDKQTEGRQEKHLSIIVKVDKLGSSVPMMDIVTETNPWILYVNEQNPLYDQKIRTASIKEYKQHTAEQYAMLCMKIKQEQGKLPATMGLNEFKEELEKHTLAVLGADPTG